MNVIIGVPNCGAANQWFEIRKFPSTNLTHVYDCPGDNHVSNKTQKYVKETDVII